MNRKNTLRLTVVAFALFATMGLVTTFHRTARASSQSSGSPTALEPFVSGSLIEPDQFAGTVSQSNDRPPVVCVGDKVLYEGAHVPGALYLGPARTTVGLDTLRKWAEKLPREKMIVIYCGCCPWGKCPNIRPAYSALQQMGFTNIKVLHLSQGFANDWVDKGFSTERAASNPSPQKTN
jgi:thiosulfate/3-mercaptopyruvate sulfurtransferase